MLYIVGNGNSRKGIDLDHIGRWYGCNGVYRDYTPNVLFAVDIPIQSEVFETDYYKNNKVAVGEWEPLEIEHAMLIKDGYKFGSYRVNEYINQGDTHVIVQGDEDWVNFLGFDNQYKDNIISYNYPDLKNLFCGMSALGYALMAGEEEICLLGFDALEDENWSNVYEGTLNYAPKYTEESRVLDAQRSQFIALLEGYKSSKVYFGNPIDGFKNIEYTRLYYYENNNDGWVLGQGLESDIMSNKM